jgi:hypothetical protein
MGSACGMYEKEEKCTLFWQRNERERKHLEDIVIDGSMILE